jgi:predicted transport protein
MGGPSTSNVSFKDFAYFAEQLEGELLDVYTAFRDYMLALGDDIQVKRLKYYEAYKRIRNVASVVIQPQKKDFVIYIYKTDNMDWKNSEIVREVDKLGHWGTGDLEIAIHTMSDLEKAKSLLEVAYERS